MNYYEKDVEDDYTEFYRCRRELSGNDDEYTLGEFAKRLIKNPDGAYEHICEYCMRFEKNDLYEIVKAFALGISYNDEESGKSVFYLAGNYLLDSIKAGLPCDEIDSFVSTEYIDDEIAHEDIADNNCLEEAFVRFRSLLEKTRKANDEEKKQYKELYNYISKLEAEYYPFKSENDENDSFSDMVFNHLYLDSVSKSDVYKAFKKRFSSVSRSNNDR